MTRSERRRRRERTICRRQERVRSGERYASGYFKRWDIVRGRLAKWNLTCDCSTCKACESRWRDVRAEHKRSLARQKSIAYG